MACLFGKAACAGRMDKWADSPPLIWRSTNSLIWEEHVKTSLLLKAQKLPPLKPIITLHFDFDGLFRMGHFKAIKLRLPSSIAAHLPLNFF
jgi:hypothetical protein